jgi:hypothetical protein
MAMFDTSKEVLIKGKVVRSTGRIRICT